MKPVLRAVQADLTTLAVDCLAEMIWQAQRQGTAYDAGLYFECLKKKLG